jgi:hypothetical protein
MKGLSSLTPGRLNDLAISNACIVASSFGTHLLGAQVSGKLASGRTLFALVGLAAARFPWRFTTHRQSSAHGFFCCYGAERPSFHLTQAARARECRSRKPASAKPAQGTNL